MSGPGMRPSLLRPSEISELMFGTDSDEAGVSSEVSSGEGVSESAPGVSQRNSTTKQPVVKSPASQFHPVPLTNRMLMRVGHVNRLSRQPCNEYAPFALRVV